MEKPTVYNVCPVKFRSKHSSVLLLCLLRIFTGQTLLKDTCIQHASFNLQSAIRKLFLELPNQITLLSPPDLKMFCLACALHAAVCSLRNRQIPCKKAEVIIFPCGQTKFCT